MDLLSQGNRKDIYRKCYFFTLKSYLHDYCCYIEIFLYFIFFSFYRLQIGPTQFHCKCVSVTQVFDFRKEKVINTTSHLKSFCHNATFEWLSI